MDELRIVDREGWRCRSKLDELSYVFKDARAPWITRNQVIVDGIGLLEVGEGGIGGQDIHGLGKLVTGEDHRDADGREQADKGQLDRLIFQGYAEAIEEVVDAVVVCAIAVRVADVVRTDVVDGLCAVGEDDVVLRVAEIAAVDHLAYGPLEGGLAIAVAPDDGVANVIAEVFVP